MSVSVLIADKSVAIQKVMEKAFRADSAYNLQFSNSFTEVGAYLSLNHVDLLICSPGVASQDQLNQLLSEKSNRNRPTVLLVHGSYDDVDRAVWVRAGVQGFLKKPFQLTDLKSEIKRLGFQFDDQTFSMPTPEQVAEPRIEAKPELALDIDPSSDTQHTMTSDEQLLKAQQWMKMAASNQTRTHAVEKHPLETSHPAATQNLSPSSQNPLVTLENERVFREIVERHCRENFKELAREILKEELATLVKAKARLHTDLPI